ncbi:hypothetical protein A3D72_00095 [Candidatus Uhrbacteria bacterium RIFCSPHIGHO2_02_FULL_57_19]|uniref:RNase H type-1 domain-containing protein n=1 Tax=Candidatus Uhrbacteria bacterium RIFCSPHIGHO2_02_FULL_57_19 TaxID=1802391 RepID=A0A1F7U5Q6_9BACT|nr:MAG: hypothetical protein A3D72_00095 [Candidatus Uhrbacteria bacterium RIFCSPHIGHO2_02_FULL_57_19]
MPKKIIIFTDGGARGNPGPAGLGVYIEDAETGKVLKRHSRFLGQTTNNQAEWRAVVDALEHAKELGAEEVELRSDSELVIKQLNREYKVKNKDLQPHFVRAWNLSLDFKKVTYRHVPRERNKEADRLVNEAIDRHLDAGRG